MDLKTTGVLCWNRLLAWGAWGVFTISFFLPAYGDNDHLYYGWECAQATAQLALRYLTLKGDFESLHLASQTLANLWMIGSLFLLPYLSRGVCGTRWLRGCSIAILLLVWSFVLRLAVEGCWSYLKIGCFLWAASFLLLVLATMTIGGREAPTITPA